MIVAAHQPNYLPWLGFFDKMSRCDKFIILDHCQFERQGFQNRTKIRWTEGTRWLTVPVAQKSRDERILDKVLAGDADARRRWAQGQYSMLAQVYRDAPHFARYAPMLRHLLDSPWERLIDLNLSLLSFCMSALELTTPLLRTSQMGELPGQKSELVLNMCKAAGATVYLAGDGASRHYLDLAAFAEAGIEVRFQGFKHPTYPQGRAETLHGLSVLDLLFNCGPASRLVLEGKAVDGAPPAPPLGELVVAKRKHPTPALDDSSGAGGPGAAAEAA